MTQKMERWPIRIADAADSDLEDILRWTVAQFGVKQALVYSDTLTSALASLAGGPQVPGVRAREDIARGLFTLHVARLGRKGRHFVIFRIGRDQRNQVIEVLRILHDSMDMTRHLPPLED